MTDYMKFADAECVEYLVDGKETKYKNIIESIVSKNYIENNLKIFYGETVFDDKNVTELLREISKGIKTESKYNENKFDKNDKDEKYGVSGLKRVKNAITNTAKLANELISELNSVSVYGCDGEVKPNKQFFVRRLKNDYGEYSVQLRPNTELFKTKSYFDDTIEGINGLVGTLHGNVKYNGIDYDITLEIRSRFDKPGKPNFLMTMLSEAMTGVAESDDRTNTVKRYEEDDIKVMDVLTVYLFRKAVNKAYQSGLYRTYVRREHNDEKLRGAIDFARHIRLNYGKNSSNIAYTTRERTEDNPINRLIAYAWQHLKRESLEATELMSSIDSDEQAMFEMAISEINGHVGQLTANVQGCIAENQRSITSPFYSGYEELRILCLDILRDEARGTIFGSGNGEEASGILFYIPDLWERFLENRLRQKLKGSGIKLEAQKQQLYYSLPGRDINGGCLPQYDLYGKESRPDYVFYKSGEPFFILDAKFRKFEPFSFAVHKDRGMLGRLSDDDPRSKLYAPWVFSPGRASGDDESSGDFDKVLRDMAVFGAHAGAVIYPVSKAVSEDLADSYTTRLTAEVNDGEYLKDTFSDRGGYLEDLYKNICQNGVDDTPFPDEESEHYPHKADISDQSSTRHMISKLNKLDRFYNYAVEIPEEDEYKDWKEHFDANTDKVFDQMLAGLEKEADRAKAISELISKL